MEVVRGAERAESRQARAEVVVVARRQHAAAASPEGADPGAVGRRQPAAGIDRKQPQLIDRRRRQADQLRVVAVGIGCPIARRDLVPKPGQMRAQQLEATDVPVVRRRGIVVVRRIRAILPRQNVHSRAPS